MGKFEVYKDNKGETRFRYRSKNGEVMFTSEGYKAKASALKSIDSLKKNIAEAPVEDVAAAAPAAKKTPAKAGAVPKAKAAAKPAASKAAAAKPAAEKAVRAKPKTAAKPKAAPAKKSKAPA